MFDERTLREKARAVVREGKLPGRRPNRTWGGLGVGALCSVCMLSISTCEMEVEIQFARLGGPPGLDTFHVHMRCFAAWELERMGLSTDDPDTDRGLWCR